MLWYRLGHILKQNHCISCKKNMNFPRRKLSLSFLWCALECLFFSGYLQGWLWMQDIIVEEGYFRDVCNMSSASPMTGNSDMYPMLHQTVTMIHSGRLVKCVYKKVTRRVSLEDYAKIQKEKDRNEESDSRSVCLKQSDKLEFIHVLVLVLRNIIIFPLGIFLDVYGTTRIRIIALCCTAFGSLTMLFSSSAYPWLILPALLMLGLAGFLILLTDLQVSNLFGTRRYTVMSVFVGAYFSGGIVIFFMKLTKATGVTLQTSFMFTTIGIVPVLISTIAMLPKSRIPWPLPAEYGTNRRVNHTEDKHAKAKAWQRRSSDDPKKKSDLSEFYETIKSKLFIFCVIWFSLLSLKVWLFDVTVDIQLTNLGVSDTPRYMSLYAVILLFSLPMSPFIGIIMDWNKTEAQHHVIQMRNIFHAVCVQFCVAVLSSLTSLISNPYVQVLSFILVAMEKVTLHATLFAFLTHVHFPCEHLGKLVGIVISISGITLTLQFPLKMLIHQGISENTFYVHIILVVIVLVSGCHPLSLWYHCKTGAINNGSEITDKDRQITVVLMESTIKKREGSENENVEEELADTNKDVDTTKLQITDL